MNIVFDPYAPLWLFWSIAAVTTGLVILSLVRNWKSGLFRVLAAAALFCLLANPQIREGETTPLDDIALILVDESGSQTLDDRNTITADAAAKLEAAISSIEGIETRVTTFGGAEETRTVEAIGAALADTPRARLGGVFVITDGQTLGDEDWRSSQVAPAPVHLFLTGQSDERDRKITLINAPRYGIVGQPVRVSFRIDDFGPDDEHVNQSGSAIVTLRVDGEEILQQPVPFGSEAGFDAPLPRPGNTVVELEVASRDGELTTQNNTAVLPITAIRDRLRVLLISGEPHPGERVWRNLLKSDPAVDLVHFTILRPIEKGDATPVSELALIQFPQDELFIDKLSQFDLLIFDRYTYRAVLDPFHFDNIARYVENGGAVLIAAGPEYNGPHSLASRRNLSFILPATPAGPSIERTFRPETTELGKRHPVTDSLPDEDIWGRWLRIMPVNQVKGQTLLAGPSGAPLLILDRVGDGRVGLILSDHVWLWARGFDGGGPHAELLRRIAHWLMKEPELEEEALSLSGQGATLIIRRRTIETETPPIALTGPDGETSEIELTELSPGRFEAQIENARRGLYRARSGELFAIGEVGLSAAPEFENVVSTRNKLAPLVEQTGGGIFNIRRNQGAELPSLRRVQSGRQKTGGGWAGIIERRASRVERIYSKPLAPPAAWLIVLIGGIMMAWLIEGGRLNRSKPAPDPSGAR